MKEIDLKILDDVKQCFAKYYAELDRGVKTSMHSSGCLTKLENLVKHSLH